MKTTLKHVRKIIRETLIREEEAGAFGVGARIKPLRGKANVFDEEGKKVGSVSDELTVTGTVEITPDGSTFSMLQAEDAEGRQILVSAADFKKADDKQVEESLSLAEQILVEKKLRKRALVEMGCGCAKCAQKVSGKPYGMGAFMYDLLVAGEEDEIAEEDTVEES